MEIAKLKFTSPLHLSKGKSGLDTSFDVLHSDTLKSALFVCALELDLLRGDDAESFFKSFTISSAFPFVGEELFFPKPGWMPKSIEHNAQQKGKNEIDRKKLKKIKYFSKKTFEQLLKGELISLNPTWVRETKYYSEIDIIEPFQSETVQRVVVSRNYDEDGSDTFYTERLYFTEGCGLFFIIDMHDATQRNTIESALLLLGDNGIGSDKSVGNGQFEFKAFEPFVFEQTQNPTKKISLSLFSPQKGEVNDETFLNDSAYSLIKRGGYIASPDNFDNSTLRKKSITMFTEGAVFPTTKTLVGDIKDLKPDIPTVKHSIWRDGRALFLPYNLKS